MTVPCVTGRILSRREAPRTVYAFVTASSLRCAGCCRSVVRGMRTRSSPATARQRAAGSDGRRAASLARALGSQAARAGRRAELSAGFARLGNGRRANRRALCYGPTRGRHDDSAAGDHGGAAEGCSKPAGCAAGAGALAVAASGRRGRRRVGPAERIQSGCNDVAASARRNAASAIAGDSQLRCRGLRAKRSERPLCHRR